MRHQLAFVAILVAITMVLSLAPVAEATSNTSPAKVPIINVISVEFGNRPFSGMETFLVHPETSSVHRTANTLNLSFESNVVSPINDTLSLNNSIHLSKDPMQVNFPVQNGTFKVSIPPEQSYLNTLTVSGNASYSYVTLLESVPADQILVNGSPINGTREVENSSVYNATVQFGNSSFLLHSQGAIYVGSALVRVSLLVSNLPGSGNSMMSFSFPIEDGSFSFVFDQVLSSGHPVNNDVMSYYQVTGFSSPFLYNLISNASSLAIGGAIFIVLVLVLFLYYRKK